MSGHPDDLASVTAANRDRLMGVAAAISTITNSERDMIDLAELEFKARAATKGEWDVFENLGQDEAWCDWHRVGPFDMTGGKASADDLFIQAAQPRVVLELIERVRAAEAKAAEPTEAMITAGAAEVRLGIAEKWSAEVIASEVHDAMQATRPAPVDTAALQERVRVLEEALIWYGEQARLCRLITREGDVGRHALDADGGKRAREALGGSNG
jgi:hypothetical protein